MLTGWGERCMWFSRPKRDVASNTYTHTKPSSESQTRTSTVQAQALAAGSTHATEYVHLCMPAGCWAYNTGASPWQGSFLFLVHKDSSTSIWTAKRCWISVTVPVWSQGYSRRTLPGRRSWPKWKLQQLRGDQLAVTGPGKRWAPGGGLARRLPLFPTSPSRPKHLEGEAGTAIGEEKKFNFKNKHEF